MAEISQIKLPNNTVLDIKDSVARQSLVLATTTNDGLMSAADKEKLNSLNIASYQEIDLSIAVADWSNSAPYTFTWTSSAVTDSSAISVVFKTDPRPVFNGDLDYDKVSGGIQFTATTKPTGAIAVVISIMNNDNTPTYLINQLADQIDIPLVETVSGTTPAITGLPNVRYVCGEVSTISITPPASGTVVVRFESGSSAAILTVPNTVKWPAWFDATALEADTTYEILITDGIYGSVMTWET